MKERGKGVNMVRSLFHHITSVNGRTMNRKRSKEIDARYRRDLAAAFLRILK